MFETVEFQVQTGQVISCAKKASVLVPINKISIYAMGKVAMYPQEELRQLQKMKQSDRKEFDRNPNNDYRLLQIKKLKHNYERSRSMFASLQQVGFTDSVHDLDRIISHLLDIGDRVTLDNKVDYPSNLEGPNGQLRVLSTWVILPDGTKYLSTINFIPR